MQKYAKIQRPFDEISCQRKPLIKTKGLYSYLKVNKHLLLVFLLSGCVSVLPPQKESSTVHIKQVNYQTLKCAKHPPLSNKQILIDIPDANPEIAGVKILVDDESAYTNYIENAVWPQKLSYYLQDRLVDAFLSSNLFKGVAKTGALMSGDYILKINYDTFNIVHKKPETCFVIEATLQIVDIKSRAVVHRKRFVTNAPMQGIKNKTLVDATSTATDQLFRSMICWVSNILYRKHTLTKR